MANAFTAVIEASDAAGEIWQAVAPAETHYEAGDDDPLELAYWIANNQTVAEGSSWRVRVWTGADADTAADPAAEVYAA